jgi:hypothetical protein
MKKFFATLSLLCLSLFSFAQDSYVEMADLMRSNGKIYVVLAVAVIIFAGLLTYLIWVDVKLKRLENRVKFEG